MPLPPPFWKVSISWCSITQTASAFLDGLVPDTEVYSLKWQSPYEVHPLHACHIWQLQTEGIFLLLHLHLIRHTTPEVPIFQSVSYHWIGL